MNNKCDKLHISSDIKELESSIENKLLHAEQKRRKLYYHTSLNAALKYQLGYTNSSESEEEDYINEWERELVSIINHKPFKIFGKDPVTIKNDTEKKIESPCNEILEIDKTKEELNEKKKPTTGVKSNKKKKANEEEKQKIKPKLPKRKKEIDFSECGSDIKGVFKKIHLIVNYMKSLRNATDFLHPVDPVKQMILDYYQYVKKPMDFSTVEANLKEGVYDHSENGFRKWMSDVRQIFMNAVNYNPPLHYVYITAVKLSNIFEGLLKSASFNIKPPLPLGLSRSVRWDDPIGWKRMEREVVLYIGNSIKANELSKSEKRKLFMMAKPHPKHI